MKHFINLKDIKTKDLKKILNDAKKEKLKDKNIIRLILTKELL